MLSFDTYNSFLHKYATPTDGKYQAEKGDFEFVIDSVGSDIIKVHGKKTGNTLYLRKLTEPAAQYMQKVVDMGDSFFPSEADLTIGAMVPTSLPLLITSPTRVCASISRCLSTVSACRTLPTTTTSSRCLPKGW